MRYSKLISILFLFISFEIIFSQDHSSWSYNLGVYEVNVRQYTQEGTFKAFQSHLDHLKNMGVGILWFMPVHPIGEQNRLGTLGSYFSVKDYKAINSEFGSLEDFKELVDTAHAMGFYVLIDWVANHTSWDNSLTVTNPEWYTKDSEGNFMPPAGTGWSDVIDLDYSQSGLREYMIEAMKYWIEETNIDGFRCDAAGMVPLDFWSAAISELKSLKPEILMLAEGDGADLQNAGFDMTFAWNLYGFGSGILPKIANGTNNANNLASFIRGEFQDYSQSHYRLHFTSNHDENSWYGTVFERFGSLSEIFAVFTHTINDVPLIYSGQEAGLNKRLQFFEKDLIPWKDHSFYTIYSTLLKFKKENKALWNGESGGKAERILTNNNPEIFAFVREKDGDKVFSIFNISGNDQTVIPEGDLFKGGYVDIFSNDTLIFTDSSSINLSSWDYKILNSIPMPTNVASAEILPTEFILEQNYPNPFNPVTTIKYNILIGVKSEKAKVNNVTLKVFDILGKEIATLVNQKQKPGNYSVRFYGTNLSSGIYYYQLQAGEFIETKKMIILK